MKVNRFPGSNPIVKGINVRIARKEAVVCPLEVLSVVHAFNI